jgi:hypothetical protein
MAPVLRGIMENHGAQAPPPHMRLIPIFGLEGVGHYIEGRFFATPCHSSFMALDDY